MPDTSEDITDLGRQRRHPARFTLRARLTLWVVGIFTTIQWGTSGIFWLYQSTTINDVFNQQLELRARKIADEVIPNLPFINRQDLNRITAGERRFVEFGNLFTDIFDAKGRSIVIGSSPYIQAGDIPRSDILDNAYPVVRQLDVPAIRGSNTESGAARVLFRPLQATDSDTYILAVITSNSFADRQLALVSRVLILAAFIGPLAAAVSGWFIGGIAVEPFARLGDLARGITPESIDESLKLDSSHAEVDRLTSELEEARRRLQEGFASQERFLSNVSHELKTPIAVMIAQAQTLDRTDLPRPVSGFIAATEQEMVRLGQLVESFLTLTRVRDGVGAARISHLAANDLVMNSVDHCMPMAEQYRIGIAPRLLEDPWLDTTVTGDPDLLRTMLDNLVRNAIRFSPLDQPVEIAMETDGTSLSVSVSDRGPGIPEDRIDNIFDRFAQAESEQRKGRGHGLGLAIAQGIAELHLGTIRARNRDQGCTFTVTLPTDPIGNHDDDN